MLKGGGQPNDTGTFTIQSSSTTPSDIQGPIELKVINVQRTGLSAVHHVLVPKDIQAKVDGEEVGAVLKPGVRVDMKVDWERRWDHVRRHLPILSPYLSYLLRPFCILTMTFISNNLFLSSPLPFGTNR